MEQKRRKYQNILGISGLATIVFGIWSIVKSILLTALNSFQGSGDTVEIDKSDLLPLFGIVLLYVLIDLLLRFYVGVSARRESKGKKKSILYLIIAGILGIITFANIIYTFLQISSLETVDIFVSVIIEMISLFALVETIIYGIRLKLLKG